MALNFLNNGYFAGKVGIGTESPASILEISSTAPVLTLRNPSANPANAGMIRFIESTNTDGFQLTFDGSDNKLKFISDSSGTEATRMVIQRADGNVGIGTTSPTAKLHIDNGGAATTAVRIDAGAVAGAIVAYGNNGNKYFELGEVGGSDPGRLSLFESGVSKIQLATNAVSYFNGGNVGIGDITPLSKLEVAGSIKSTNYDTSHTSESGVTLGYNVTEAMAYLETWTSKPLTFRTYNYQAFNISGNEAMRIDTSRRLLINATSTVFGDKLYINSDAYSTGGWRVGSGSTYVGQIRNNAGKLEIVTDTSRDIQFGDVGTPNIMYIDTSAENVGIGTTSPDAKLDIKGNFESIYALKFTNTKGTGRVYGFRSHGLNGEDLTIYNGANRIQRWDENGNSVFDGKVGIGTDNPSRNLEVSSVGTGTHAYIKILGDSTKEAILELHADNDAAGDRWRIASGNSARLDFRSNGSTKVSFQGGGNVGIGTTAPSQKLHVDGNVLINGAAPYVSIKTTQTGTPDWKIYNSYNTTGDFAIVGGSSVSNKFNIQPNGNIGIGTVSPTAGLHVVGTGLFTGLVSGITPVAAANFVTKAYVDGSGGGTGPFLPLAGGTMTGTAGVVFPDDFKLNLGAGSDLQIYHGGVNSHIDQNGSGDLYIKNTRADGDIFFQGDDGTGSAVANYFLINGGGQETRFQKNTRHNDNVLAQFGNSDDLKIFHNATDSFIINEVGDLKITQGANDKDIIFESDNGGGGTSQYLRLDGGIAKTVFSRDAQFLDNAKALFGSSYDLQIYHNGTDSVIENFGGDLYITNKADNKDIVFRSDNGSGSFTTYFFLDGSNERLQVDAPNGMLFSDNITAKFGDSADLEIYHDGSNSYIKDNGLGDLRFMASNIKFYDNGTAELMAQMIPNGAVELYYNNIKKLSTGSVGVGTATTAGGTLIDGWITTTQANAINNTTIATTAYVNNKIALIPAGLVFQGTWNAATNTPTLASGTGTTGHFYIVSVAGSTNLDGITDWKVGDWAVFIEQGASDQWEKIDNSSVLDGFGTGQSVTKWDGSGTSNTLTNGPITFSTNDSTFAGKILNTYTGTGSHELQNATNNGTVLRLTTTGDGRVLTLQTDHIFSNGQLFIGDNSYATNFRGSAYNFANGNATFAGDVNLAAGKKLQYSANSFITPENNTSGAEISTAGTFIVKTGSTPTLGLTLDASQNATFAGQVQTGTDLIVGGGDISLVGTGRIQGVDTVSASTDAANKAYVDAHGGGLGPFLPLAGGTMTGRIITTSTEAMRINANDAFISGYSSNGATRNGYIQFQSNGVFIDAETGQRRIILGLNNLNKVGIGTTTPGGKLDIYYSGTGGTGTQGIGEGLNITSLTPNITFNDLSSSVDNYAIHLNQNVLTLGRYTSATSQSPDLVLVSGKVGIGTTNPFAKLHVKDGNTLSSALTNTSALIEGFSQSILQIASHSSGFSQIAFGDQDDGFDGGFIYSNASRYLSIETANAERMRIISTGNVGIGTTNIGTESNLYLGANSSAEGGQITLQKATSGTLAAHIDAHTTGGKDYMRILSGGDTSTSAAPFVFDLTNVRVGIGTNSPSAPLEIAGAASASDTGITIKNGSATRLRLFHDDNGGSSYLTSYRGVGAAQRLIIESGNDLNLSGGGGSAHMVIKTSGNVGIGTTSPLHNLQIGTAATNGSYSMMIEGNFANDALASNPRLNLIDTNFGITAGKYGSGSANDALGIFAFQGAGRGIVFAHTTAGSGTHLKDMRQDMFIDGGTGNVGIGTNSPTAKLHLAVNSANDDTFHIFNGSVRTHLLASESTNGVIYMRSSANTNTVRINASGDSYFNGGNVGIGTTSPNEKLEVNGNIRLGNSASLLWGSNNLTLKTASSSTIGVFSLAPNSSGTVYAPRFQMLNASSVIGVSIRTDASSFFNGGNVGIGTTSPGAKLHLVSSGSDFFPLRLNSSSAKTWQIGVGGTNYYDGQFLLQDSSVGERLRINSAGTFTLPAYNSTNQTGTPTYLLGTDASGTVVKTLSTPSPITSQAASLYDLIPNGAFTTTYAFTSTAGTYAEVMGR